MPIFQPHSHIQLPFIQPHQQHTQYLSPTTHTQQSPPTTLTKTYPTNQTTHNIINHHPLQTTLQSTPKYSRPHTTINPSINPPIFTTTHYKQSTNIHHHTPQTTHPSTPQIFTTTHYRQSTNQPTNQLPKYSPPHTTPFHINHTHQSIPQLHHTPQSTHQSTPQIFTRHNTPYTTRTHNHNAPIQSTHPTQFIIHTPRPHLRSGGIHTHTNTTHFNFATT